MSVAGADEAADLDGDILDQEFGDLGYDSIAVLEAVGKVQRDRGFVLDEDALSDVRTFGELLELINVYA